MEKTDKTTEKVCVLLIHHVDDNETVARVFHTRQGVLDAIEEEINQYYKEECTDDDEGAEQSRHDEIARMRKAMDERGYWTSYDEVTYVFYEQEVRG